MTQDEMDRQAFVAWWYASKYMQVVFSSEAQQQAALDGWQAALRHERKSSATHLPPLTHDQLMRIELKNLVEITPVDSLARKQFIAHYFATEEEALRRRQTLLKAGQY